MTAARSVRAFAIIGALLAFAVLSSAPSWAKGEDSGAAAFIEPATNNALPSGGSQTEWSLKLPSPPASNCSGDSANDAYFVYSYIASASVDPADLTFNPSTGPDAIAGQLALPLIDAAGKPYISANTALESGQVMPGTRYTFSRLRAAGATGAPLPPGAAFADLPMGSYNVGIACWDANSRTADKFWNTTVAVAANSTDPNGFTWRATGGTTAAQDSDSSGSSVVVIAVVAAAVMIGIVLVLRRRRAAAQ